jgi:hypothetical protein
MAEHVGGRGREIMTDAQQKAIDEDFVKETKLFQDVMNIFEEPVLLASDIGSLNALARLPTYSDHFYNVHKMGPAFRYIIEKSDPKTVEEFNKVVKDYNTNLDQIKSEDNRNEVIRFANLAGKIVLGDDWEDRPEIQK